MNLPWSYPGAEEPRETPAPPRLPGRRSPLDLARYSSPSLQSLRPFHPSTLPPFHPPPPGAPQGPRVSQKPPAHAYPTLELPLDPRRAPLGGLRPDGRPGPPRLGSWSNSHFPQKHFLWEIRQIDSRPREGRRGKKAEGITYPRAPTLELDTGLPYTSSRREGRKSNQTKPNQTHQE